MFIVKEKQEPCFINLIIYTLSFSLCDELMRLQLLFVTIPSRKSQLAFFLVFIKQQSPLWLPKKWNKLHWPIIASRFFHLNGGLLPFLSTWSSIHIPQSNGSLNCLGRQRLCLCEFHLTLYLKDLKINGLRQENYNIQAEFDQAYS